MGQIVKLKVVEVPTSIMNVKSSKGTTPKILPGVNHSISPSLDSFGRMNTGVTSEEYMKIMSADGGEPIPYQKFYTNFCIKVSDKGKDLDLSIPKHKLMYALLKISKEVAKNKAEVNSAVHTFYIEDENEEALKKLSSIEAKKVAYSLFSEMAPSEIRDFLVLFGKDVSNVSDKVAEAKLGELIEINPGKFTKMFKDVNKEVKINLRKLVANGIVRKEGPVHFFGEEGEAVMLGSTEELAMAFLTDAKNQDLYISLLQNLE
jgi:hypothetical protein